MDLDSTCITNFVSTESNRKPWENFQTPNSIKEEQNSVEFISWQPKATKTQAQEIYKETALKRNKDVSFMFCPNSLHLWRFRKDSR